MDRLEQRLEVARKAMAAFDEVMNLDDHTSIERDASIQRFEFTWEVTWKAAKQWLYEQEGIDVGSPKGVIRSCREVGLFNDEETKHALQMADDRNLTVHAYDEKWALKIFERLKQHRPLLKTWLDRLNEKNSSL